MKTKRKKLKAKTRAQWIGEAASIAMRSEWGIDIEDMLDRRARGLTPKQAVEELFAEIRENE